TLAQKCGHRSMFTSQPCRADGNVRAGTEVRNGVAGQSITAIEFSLSQARPAMPAACPVTGVVQGALAWSRRKVVTSCCGRSASFVRLTRGYGVDRTTSAAFVADRPVGGLTESWGAFPLWNEKISFSLEPPISRATCEARRSRRRICSLGCAREWDIPAPTS